jgi:hypothetical protein
VVSLLWHDGVQRLRHTNTYMHTDTQTHWHTNAHTHMVAGTF